MSHRNVSSRLAARTYPTAIISPLEESETLTLIGETLRPLLTNDMGSAIEVYDTSGDDGMGPPPTSTGRARATS